LKKISLGIFIIVALLAIPAYLTGEPAEELVENLPGVSKTSIEQHEEAAQVAFAGVLIVGVAALGGLFFFRRDKAIPNWLAIIVLVLSLIVFALMARTADLGGLIRHTEIRQEFTCQWSTTRNLIETKQSSQFVQASNRVFQPCRSSLSGVKVAKLKGRCSCFQSDTLWPGREGTP
jgi:hypothetical protein